jgi:uncharacterized repeat protein (TIGR01451 family)
MGVRMLPKLITLKKGNCMKVTPRLRNRTTSASRSYNRSNTQHDNRHSKNLFKKSIVVLNILLLLLCLWISQFSYYGKAAEEPVVGPIGLEKYITIWTFGEPDYFNATETTIDDNEVVLRSYNYNWNQTSKKDFDKGEKDNVAVSQRSIIEGMRSWDFESGEEGWEHGINTGGMDEWQHGNVSDIPEFIGPHDSGSYLWGTNLGGKYDDNVGTARDYFLKSPNIDLTEYENIEMSFWHYYDFEDDSNYNDGGIIEVSIDNGENWEQIDPKTGYTGTIEDPNNPLHPSWCFAGNSTKWEVARFDLSNYAGNQNFSVRFRFATNGDVSDYGWYIDDIEITSTTSSDGEVELMPRNIGIGTGDVNIIERPAGETVIDTNNPANVDALLTEWTVNIVNITPPARGIMKIFRMVGGEFIFVAQTEPEDIITGENTFDCEIEVKAGDYIGWYGENAKIFVNSEGSAYNMSGNISEDFPISSWTPIGYTFSIKAEGLSKHSVGILTSQVFDAGSSAIWEQIRWGEDFPILEVDIVLQTRTGNSSNTTHSSWSDWSSPLSENTGSAINRPNARYIQFKATLTTSRQPYTPSLSDTSIFYRKYSPHGEVETKDLMPGVTHLPLGGMVVQWLDFSADVVPNGQYIGYYYSLDSGETWQSIPENYDLTSVSVLEGKIRLKITLSTEDTTISPVVEQMDLTYSSATPDMGLFVETDKNDVKPGDTISYTIFYDNKGKGDAKDVIITLELDVNVSYIGEDNSPVPSTIEEGNIRKWHFDIVNPGNRSFFVYAKVKELREDASISTLAVLNYSDLGGHHYPNVNSTGSTIKVMVEQDLLPYYIALGVIIIIISFALLAWHRYRVLREAEKIILIENMEKGIGYLIMEENPSKSYGVFSDLIDEGYSGLCITRTFPGRVISNYSFEGVSILWLSRTRDENSILPTNLSALLRSAKDFLEANKEVVILLDGLEYLMVHNDFQRVLKMVHGLNELTAIHDARLIMPLNPVALDKEKLAILKRDLKMLG